MTRWTNDEREVIAEAWEEWEAWETYRAQFGFNHRTYESIRREWFRQHPKVTA